ncbi:iron complex transport system substrate-binding protein [Naumannella cuiyingiana]|uniref:Iron complex transport system substrate-binding protein n=1 Tax=Naumannella cuiyingiana TaxID=1347891 RepID=A0A7Z0IL73_9ACTN|nr:ABC transporter substrate-binding protein [Naumannella cuiyingiana]NYI71298.1 iron complex transport system substrate-binding protein [Naumannella cuiyingiana]
MPTTRRTFLTGLSVLAAAPALAACSTGGAPADQQPAAGPAGAGFPVTIEHKFGSTTIEREPQRVVLVGLTDQDTMLALGKAPVAVTDWYADDTPGRIYPWALDKLGDAPLPEVLSGEEIEFERIASLAPDLILGQYAGVQQADYEKLSALAPTVVQPGNVPDYGAPWDVAAITIGRAIGKEAAARELVDGVKRQLAEAAAANGFAGRSGAVLSAWEGMYVYGPDDPRSQMLRELGFAFPEKLLQGKSDRFGWALSPERTTDLNGVDLAIWTATPDQVAQQTGGVWAKTDTAKQGRGIFIEPKPADYDIAFSFVTPLSIPYVLQRLTPQLVAAIDGDPATKIPPPGA